MASLQFVGGRLFSLVRIYMDRHIERTETRIRRKRSPARKAGLLLIRDLMVSLMFDRLGFGPPEGEQE
jgi:hypothetical protein